jgi:ADP-heptose:LPS heptosyltransferase
VNFEEETPGEPIASRSINHILVIRTGAIGDFVLTLPVIHSLRLSFPLARIALLGNPTILSLAQGFITEIIDFNLSGMHTIYHPAGMIDERIRKMLARFDLVISYTTDQGGLLIRNLKSLGIPWVLDGTFSLQKPTTPVGELLLAPLRRAGISVVAKPPTLSPSESARKFAQQLLDGALAPGVHSGGVIAIHPGSGNSKKCWPGAHYASLIRWLRTYLGATVVLVRGPADTQTARTIAPGLNGLEVVVFENLELSLLAALLERCSAFVGNDSGITHLAAAVGVPTVALFGPTDSHLWGPRNKQVVCLQSTYPCAPCSPQAMASCPRPRCLEALSLEEVIEALRSAAPRAYVNNGFREEWCCVQGQGKEV